MKHDILQFLLRVAAVDRLLTTCNGFLCITTSLDVLKKEREKAFDRLL